MSRAGTCKCCHAIAEMWRIPTTPQPHQKAETHVVMPDGEYTCQWLDQFEKLPPPLQRRNGGISLNDKDCDACDLYEPVVTIEEIFIRP